MLFRSDDGSTGVSEILALSVDSFLVLERTTNKEDGNVVRLFLATTGGTSSDIKNTRELKSEKYIPLQKKLLLDFSKIKVKKTDNIEGMTWGYPIGNKKTILFISDNNFKETQVTQLILFEWVNGE